MVVWQGITASGTAVPVQVTEFGEVVAATNTPVPGPEGPSGADGKDGAPGPEGPPGKDGDQWIEINSRLIKPTNNVGISVLLDSEFGGTLTAAGTITSQGADGAGSGGQIICGLAISSSATNRSGVTLVGQGISTQGKVSIQAKNGTTKSNPALQVFYGNSSAYKIDYNGTAAFTNAILNLEPENSANYVSTTNADGETETAYNGPTLDVKQTILSLLSRIEALESQTSTGSVPED